MNESLESISYNNNEANATNLNVTYLAEQNVTAKILEDILRLAKTNPTSLNNTYLAEQNIVPEISLDQLRLVILTSYIIIGTVGNSMVCLAILLDRKLQNHTNYFLLSLAVTDLLVTIFILPSNVARILVGNLTFYWDYLLRFGSVYLITASAVHICFISLGRYFAIKNPLKQRPLTKNRIAIRIGLVWLVAFLITIPRITEVIIFGWLVHSYAHILTGLAFAIMIVIIIASLLMTSVLLHQLIKEQKENTQRSDTRLARTVGGNRGDEKLAQALQSEQKALIVVWLVSFAFMICLGPETFVILYYYFCPDANIPESLTILINSLLYASSIVNPIIYTIFNKRFRSNFKNYILCKY